MEQEAKGSPEDYSVVVSERFWFLYERNRSKEALEVALEYIRLKPDKEHGYLLCSLAFKRLEYLQEALEYIDKALSIDPSDAYNLRIKADIFYQQDKYSEAIELLLSALQIEPQHCQSYAALAENEFMLGNTDKAVEYVSESLKIEPNADALKTLARIDYHLGNYTLASEWIRRALEFEPENYYFNYLKGQIDLKQRRYASGKDSFLTALRQVPDHEGSQEGMIELLKLEFMPFRLYLLLQEKLRQSFLLRFFVVVAPVIIGFIVATMCDFPALTLFIPVTSYCIMAAFSAIIHQVARASISFSQLGKHLLPRYRYFTGIYLFCHFVLIVLGFILLFSLYGSTYNLFLFFLFTSLFHFAAAFKGASNTRMSYFYFATILFGWAGLICYLNDLNYVLVNLLMLNYFIFSFIHIFPAFISFIKGKGQLEPV